MTTTSHRIEARRFAHHPREIGAARGWVDEVLTGWGMPDQVAAMQLAVSELVTNAVVHGQGTICVTLQTDSGEVRLIVSDEGHGAPHRRWGATADDGAGGWGLGLVDDVADGWGTISTDDGTEVWVVRRTADPALGGGWGGH